MSDQTDCKYSVEGGALCFDGLYIQLASAGEMALASEIDHLKRTVLVAAALLSTTDDWKHKHPDECREMLMLMGGASE